MLTVRDKMFADESDGLSYDRTIDPEGFGGIDVHCHTYGSLQCYEDREEVYWIEDIGNRGNYVMVAPADFLYEYIEDYVNEYGEWP